MKQHRIGYRLHTTAALLLLTGLSSISAFGQGSATLSGTVTDAHTGEVLPGANIVFVGAGTGATSNGMGRYQVRNLSAGIYTVRVTYIGYITITSSLKVQEGIDVRKDFSLVAIALQGEDVVVTGQAAGQNEAINRELSSMPVMNVVPAMRVQELPDANAAEAVTRLPGVSLIRTGGEGSQVVIRGLSPQYNMITVEGVELPSNVLSNNNLTSANKSMQEAQANILGDRAEDLRMISSSMLGGIEVIKAITPDMDATLIGGVVNFDLRKAARGQSNEGSWIPKMDLRAQGGYNDLKETRNDYRIDGTVERRFFDDTFGIFIQASSERRNVSSNDLGVTYILNDKTHGDAGIPDLSYVELTDYYRILKRVGGTAVLDYQHDDGEIDFMNFASSNRTQAVVRGESIVPGNDYLNYNAGKSDNYLDVITNLLTVRHEIPIFHMDLKLSHSYAESRDPQDLSFYFSQHPAGYAGLRYVSKEPPALVASYVRPADTRAFLSSITTSEAFSRERTIAGNLDLRTNVWLTEGVSTTFKFGGSWQHRMRWYEVNYYSVSASEAVGVLSQAYPGLIPSMPNTRGFLDLHSFVEEGYRYGTFLNGDYNLQYPINADLMWQVLPSVQKTAVGVYSEGYRGLTVSALNNYNGTEDKSAGFAMVTFNIGDWITILPGVRYQNLTTTYSGARATINPPPLPIQIAGATVTQTHGYWLPMAHVRFKPLDWLQLHFAYTNTLEYPDYSAVTPRYLVYVQQNFITYNNWRIKPARSENFDLVAAIHSNEIGLFTLNGFKKHIKDLMFFTKEYRTDLSAYPELPQNWNFVWEFNTYINNPIPIDLYGMEVEWQTHFWYLPSPFSGIVLNVNYTHIFSQAAYPKNVLVNNYDDYGNWSQTSVSTPYNARLLNQPNDLVNVSLGYDYKGFSARVSLLGRDNIFMHPDFWMQNRIISASYMRWDFSVKQELPWLGMQVFFDMNNITNAYELGLNQKTEFPAYEDVYGMSADVGLRIRI